MPASQSLYRLRPLAEADLEEIWLCTLKRWSLEQADSYHHALVDAFAGLATGTKIGRATDIRDGIFKYAVGSHIAFHTKAAFGIDVVRVLHERMDVGRRL